jgi:PBP1b-binding outer membrane lipoprotein LpoB
LHFTAKIINMNNFITTIIGAALLLSSCKKSATDTGTPGTTATVKFTNSLTIAQRVIVTGTGAADTVYPFPNKVLDFDVPASSSVTRTDVPEGTRKIYTAIVCTAGQPVNALCTTIVFRRAVYVKGNAYTETF